MGNKKWQFTRTGNVQQSWPSSLTDLLFVISNKDTIERQQTHRRTDLISNYYTIKLEKGKINLKN